MRFPFSAPAFLLIYLGTSLLHAADSAKQLLRLQVSENRRFLQTRDGKPFFWLGDTAWLLFQNLDRSEAERYLTDRQRKGFNVIQVMMLHSMADKTVYGAPALTGGDVSRPRIVPGNDPARPAEYDYWDHVDWIVDRAAERGLYLGMVVCWGSVVKKGSVNRNNAAQWASFLAQRYRNKSNIVWITGGDIRGDQNAEVWRIIGRTLKEQDPDHLVTYHPFGRTQSSTWFHQEDWLDFNMFQSGHRRYDQDTTPGAKGEDNWRYVSEDYARRPVKPTLDGEPSYENLPQGLHDPKQSYWTANDVRRYAYWSVFAGSFGHTYGENAVIQMYKPGLKPAYGVRTTWAEGITAPGSSQLQFLKKLILSRPYFERIPDQSLLDGQNGTKYDYVIATRGRSYAFAYTWTGRSFKVRLGVLTGSHVRAWWYDPRTGKAQVIGRFVNRGTRMFDPPGNPAPGNDWVLVLDDDDGKPSPPGRVLGNRSNG